MIDCFANEAAGLRHSVLYLLPNSIGAIAPSFFMSRLDEIEMNSTLERRKAESSLPSIYWMVSGMAGGLVVFGSGWAATGLLEAFSSS